MKKTFDVCNISLINRVEPDLAWKLLSEADTLGFIEYHYPLHRTEMKKNHPDDFTEDCRNIRFEQYVVAFSGDLP